MEELGLPIPPRPEKYNVQLPECALHVWQWYHELSSTRQCGMSINAISYFEIDAWSRLKGIRLYGWELDCITGIDQAFLQDYYEQQKKK